MHQGKTVVIKKNKRNLDFCRGEIEEGTVPTSVPHKGKTQAAASLTEQATVFLCILMVMCFHKQGFMPLFHCRVYLNASLTDRVAFLLLILIAGQ